MLAQAHKQVLQSGWEGNFCQSYKRVVPGAQDEILEQFAHIPYSTP